MSDVRFEWDRTKDQENQRKHGVSFDQAQWAFTDSRRVVAKDLGHSDKEERYYCFGRVDEGIMTVRFTYRHRVIRIIGGRFLAEGKENL